MLGAQVPATMEINVVDVSRQQLDEALAKAKVAVPAETFDVLEKVVCAYSTVLQELESKNSSIRRLRNMVFGSSSEKISKVLATSDALQNAKATGARGNGGKAKSPRLPPPGHGRNGHSAYPGAKTVCVSHHKLKPGDRCPACGKGRVYEQRERPKVLVRVTGQPPLAATIYLLQRLRCNLCAKVFPACPPIDSGAKKYDASAASMIGLLKYGGGFPWNRLDKLQSSVGIPLPPSTQWDIVRDTARKIEPACEELRRQAAQGEVLYNDDTPMKILAWMGRRREASLRERSTLATDERPEEQPSPDRTGIFTSGIVSRVAGRHIALFFTGVRHAGENLKALLLKRDRGLASPIQMCDALSRNIPKAFQTILANCLAHGRRQFVEQAENFPPECAHILGVLAKVYKNDAIAKKRKMTDAERLRFHQDKSGSPMEKLHAWMQARLAGKKVEPNSGLGEAIGYMLKHWEKLTLFLRQAGAPLDNNICERALKKAILHRKNSLFYKTDTGAGVGDTYMSLIHTCALNGADPFDYITQLQRHAKEVREKPEKWMPWNYRQTIDCAPPP